MTDLASYLELFLPLGLVATFSRDGDGALVWRIGDTSDYEVGAAVLIVDGCSGYFEDVWLSPHIRRQGVASALYAAVEEQGISLIPPPGGDDDVSRFWESRSSLQESEIQR
ncbi:GNAT family N-acetyltransferase [Agrobacterium rubi]|nr:GNAT family N-acetyltransferase [Agrobacterium rubi]NTF24268.1 GNAT family N-acetyltransferase [Agrobacterium rubi]